MPKVAQGKIHVKGMGKVGRKQCDQIGRFFALWATF